MTFLIALASSSGVLALYTLLLAIFQPAIIEAQSLSPAPAPAPTSDGDYPFSYLLFHLISQLSHIIECTSIDQGIAYVLMLVALVLTYLVHPLNTSFYNL
ncbi:hypothetical protein AHAS_Ahas13G0189100 [Arachis hypogaea]|uniref:Uncharacterized protein n=1 Tax=Arachis hypogaea TaxID=3818 RepID=A0A445A402_ARAHY|nr:hypothetical protein Ahy_B03g066330 [Arachis hypogaea]